MIKRTLKYILFVGIPLLVLFSTCKKYPEDAKNLWTSPTKRILGKEWNVVEFTVNGVDSLNHLFYCQKITTFNNITTTDTVYWSFLGAKLSFLKDASVNFFLKVFYTSSYHPNEYLNGCTWGFTDNDSRIFIKSNEYWKWDNFDGLFYYLGDSNNNTWTIKKLTDKEFIIESINNNKKLYRLKMN